MNTDIMPKNPKMLHRVINIILLFINAFFAIGIFSMYSFETIGTYKKAYLIVSAIALAAFMFIKEIYIRTLIKKMYLNMAIFVGYILIIVCLGLIW